MHCSRERYFDSRMDGAGASSLPVTSQQTSPSLVVWQSWKSGTSSRQSGMPKRLVRMGGLPLPRFFWASTPKLWARTGTVLARYAVRFRSCLGGLCPFFLLFFAIRILGQGSVVAVHRL